MRQDALRPPDTAAVRHRSGLSGVRAWAAVRCHESVTSRYDRAWTRPDDDARKPLRINKYRVQHSSGKSTSRDLKSVKCRFKSDWGHQRPFGSRFLDRTVLFGWWRGTRWTTTDLSGQPRQRILDPRGDVRSPLPYRGIRAAQGRSSGWAVVLRGCSVSRGCHN